MLSTLKYRSLILRWLGMNMVAMTFGALAAEPASNSNEEMFPNPDSAITAFKSAIETDDHPALEKIFGSDLQSLLTGDNVEDENHIKKFAAAMAQSCHPVTQEDGKITLQVGPNDWPMPIPLVKTGGQWHFDTAAGEDEIINRNIGKDELHAIAVCRAYVAAQREYARFNPEGNPEPTYAQHLKSKPGQKDGLYWTTANGEKLSPFGPLIASAQSEGYKIYPQGTGPHPFHGYYFRILTKQGAAAPGGQLDYIDHGRMTRGFALIAYPIEWGDSGIMTFIVNQEGKVFQCDLGKDTVQIAGAASEYNPDKNWSLVTDEGVSDEIPRK